MAYAHIQRWALIVPTTIRYVTSLVQTMPTLIASAGYPCLITSLKFPYLVTSFHCFAHWKARPLQPPKFVNGQTQFRLVCVKLLSGWVNSGDPELQPYQSRESEFSVQDGCVLWGSRVVIPKKGREAVI